MMAFLNLIMFKVILNNFKSSFLPTAIDLWNATHMNQKISNLNLVLEQFPYSTFKAFLFFFGKTILECHLKKI